MAALNGVMNRRTKNESHSPNDVQYLSPCWWLCLVSVPSSRGLGDNAVWPSVDYITSFRISELISRVARETVIDASKLGCI